MDIPRVVQQEPAEVESEMRRKLAYELQPNEKAVLKVVGRKPVNRRHIAALTHMEIGSVCARLDTLIRRGLIERAGMARCPVTQKKTQTFRSSQRSRRRL